MKRVTSPEIVEAAVLGGALLGGGGGGSIEEGLQLGRLALERGGPVLADPEDLDGEAIVLTVSAVGSPSAGRRGEQPDHYVSAVERFLEVFDLPVAGLITNENGGLATVNGWLQSAVLGLPVIDAPCNGRAHPTGLMGAMGLETEPGYRSRQVAVSADLDLMVCVEATLEAAARLVREAAVAAGGLVAVARNPVSIAYARQHGAPGAISQAIELGRLLARDGSGAERRVEAVAARLGGEVLCRGGVGGKTLESRGGFDTGRLSVGDYELTIWNEYMTLDRDGRRVATFPDLIATLSADSARPLSSAEVQPGDEVFLLRAPLQSLTLGEGMRRPELFRQVEGVLGRPVLAFVFPAATEV